MMLHRILKLTAIGKRITVPKNHSLSVASATTTRRTASSSAKPGGERQESSSSPPLRSDHDKNNNNNLNNNDASVPTNRGMDPQEYLARQDALQHEHLQARQSELLERYQRQQQPGDGDKPIEMAPDLHAFIKNVNPVVEKVLDTTVSPTKQQQQPRLPRHLRDDDGEEQEVFDDSVGRRHESMPLVERIEGFETKRTTNFSRRQEKQMTKIFKAADAVDLYDLLKTYQERQQINTTSNQDASSETDSTNITSMLTEAKETAMAPIDMDEFVTEVYNEYAEKHELPDEKNQEQHKQLLASTLKYLRLPVVLKDTEGGFDGVPVELVDEFKTFHRATEVPKTTAKLVLEDLSDARKLEAKPSPRVDEDSN